MTATASLEPDKITESPPSGATSVVKRKAVKGYHLRVRLHAPPPNLIKSIKDASRLQLADIVAHGLATQDVEKLAKWASIPVAELTEAVGIAISTFNRRKRDHVALSPADSAGPVRLALAMAKADEVFENDHDAAVRWFSTPAPALEGRTPMSCMSSEFAAQEVLQLLIRMDQGVYS